jgi:hypothetical protein
MAEARRDAAEVKKDAIEKIRAMDIPAYARSRILAKLNKTDDKELLEINKILRQEQRLLRYKGPRFARIQQRNYDRMKTIMRKNGLSPRETLIVAATVTASAGIGNLLIGASIASKSLLLAKLGIATKAIGKFGPLAYLGTRVAARKSRKLQRFLPRISRRK